MLTWPYFLKQTALQYKYIAFNLFMCTSSYSCNSSQDQNKSQTFSRKMPAVWVEWNREGSGIPLTFYCNGNVVAGEQRAVRMSAPAHYPVYVMHYLAWIWMSNRRVLRHWRLRYAMCVCGIIYLSLYTHTHTYMSKTYECKDIELLCIYYIVYIGHRNRHYDVRGLWMERQVFSRHWNGYQISLSLYSL